MSESARQVLWAFGFAGFGISEEIEPLALPEGGLPQRLTPHRDAPPSAGPEENARRRTESARRAARGVSRRRRTAPCRQANGCSSPCSLGSASLPCRRLDLVRRPGRQRLASSSGQSAAVGKPKQLAKSVCLRSRIGPDRFSAAYSWLFNAGCTANTRFAGSFTSDLHRERERGQQPIDSRAPLCA